MISYNIYFRFQVNKPVSLRLKRFLAPHNATLLKRSLTDFLKLKFAIDAIYVVSM